MSHSHPIFSRWYNFTASFQERMGYAQLRKQVLAPARGRVLAVGIGPGYDLLHLPPAVESVVAVEPDATMRRIAARRAAKAGVPLEVIKSVGERLPFGDNEFDTVLSVLVLCSVDDIPAVLGEMRRVLRPDGQLLVCEHVRAADGSSLSRWQDRFAFPWSLFGGGCRPNRRTPEFFKKSGFDTSGLVEEGVDGLPPLISPHLRGLARP
jgi:ubiquinone/menaquinone biosynthesis C-methylase UbiE